MLARSQMVRWLATPVAVVFVAGSLTGAPLVFAEATSDDEELVYHFCMKKEFQYSGRVFFSGLFASDAEQKEIRAGFADYVSARYGVDDNNVSCTDGARAEVQEALLSARKEFRSEIVNTQWAAIEH